MADRAASMWGGRFEGESDPLFRALNDSLAFDWTLVRQDVLGSMAWSRALRHAGVLNADEDAALQAALREVAALADATPDAPQNSGAEDVHSWVEAELTRRVGPLGRKLHTGRSRNDQVATDLRLWLRDQIGDRLRELHAARSALLNLAQREAGTVFPGYTHLQRAQPVLFAHWCLAHFEALGRDAARLRDAADRLGECPLGSGALAGTAFPIDRAALARGLGFDGPTRNSLDAVSSRDGALEALAALALCAVALSRIAEDLIVYSSAEFGLVEMSDAVTSGSSLMPQKKNPDAAELLRGKSGRVIGALVALLTACKGLPLAYNKDLQEDKEPLIDAMRTLSLSLRALAPVLAGLQVRRDAALAAARGGHSNATELADHLVDKGVPFRDAHDAAGRAVRLALQRGVALEDLPLADLRGIDHRIDEGVYARLAVESALARRDVEGGVAPRRVARALDAARRRLAIHAPPPAAVRVRHARAEDAAGVARILTTWAASGETLRRTPEDVAGHIREFTVALDAGAVVGCGALVVESRDLAEIRSLAVDPSRTKRGIGSAVVRRLCADAERLGLRRVFVLTCSPGFFASLGFERASADDLGPAAKAAWARRDRAGADWRFLAWESPS